VDIVGWVTPQASAARPKCRSLAKAKRSSSLSINKQDPSDILHLNAIMTITATTWQDTPKTAFLRAKDTIMFLYHPISYVNQCAFSIAA
jgi:hypothetical protein